MVDNAKKTVNSITENLDYTGETNAALAIRPEGGKVSMVLSSLCDILTTI